MRRAIPPRPTGSDEEAQYAKSLWDKNHGTESRLISSSTVRINQTSRGISFHAKPQRGGGAAAPTTSVKLFQIKQILGEYLICVDNANTITRVAKPYGLRNTVGSAVFFTGGTPVSFSYPYDGVAGSVYSYISRYAQIIGAGVQPERQIIIPFYLTTKVFAGVGGFTTVLAVKTFTNVSTQAGDASPKDGNFDGAAPAVGTSVGWQDLNVDGRAWARSADQTF